MTKRYIVLFLLSTLALQACSSSGGSYSYTVRRGDSLSLIAKRHNMSIDQLARMNNISNPNQINVGQSLRIKGSSIRDPRSSLRSTSVASAASKRPNVSNSRTTAIRPTSSTAIPKKAGGGSYKETGSTSITNWIKPTSGNITKSYNPNIPGQKGIQIAGSSNQVINAANNGEIVFAGQGNTGYGQLIIIKHDSTTYSAYGYLSSISVKEGDRIRKGQQIATMGQSIDGRTVLYFEIRSNGQTLNPMRYIQ